MSSRVPPFMKRFRRMITISDLLTGRKAVIPGEGITRVYGRHGENILLKDPYRAASAVFAKAAPTDGGKSLTYRPVRDRIVSVPDNSSLEPTVITEA